LGFKVQIDDIGIYFAGGEEEVEPSLVTLLFLSSEFGGKKMCMK
jgi:hypothetical protein